MTRTASYLTERNARITRELRLDDAALLTLYPGYATAADAREGLEREMEDEDAAEADHYAEPDELCDWPQEKRTLSVYCGEGRGWRPLHPEPDQTALQVLRRGLVRYEVLPFKVVSQGMAGNFSAKVLRIGDRQVRFGDRTTSLEDARPITLAPLSGTVMHHEADTD